MQNYKVTEVPWQRHKTTLLKIRFKVFVEEQNVPEDIEVDEWDERSVHVLAENQGQAIGTGRLMPDGHIGRIAVLPNFRGQGAGKAITMQLVDMAKAAGHKRVALSAQITARDFYAKIGFKSQGEPYEEAGISHIAMSMEL